MDRRRKFWLGLLVLLLAPLLVLVAFAVYVYVANARPQNGDLKTRVSPQVVMPWSESAYYMDYAGFTPTPTPVPVATAPPTPTPVPKSSLIDMVLIVDESSSMTSSIGAMASAAQSVVQDLANERKGRIRYSAIRFDDTAQTQTDWTDKPEKLVEGLNAIAQAPQGRGTDGRVAFLKLRELVATARPDAEKVVIFYTDGLMYPCDTCGEEIIEAARGFRDIEKVEFYSVGLPYQGSDPIMTEITGDPDRVFDPLNPAELTQMFQEIKATVAPSSTPGSAGLSSTRTPRSTSGQLSHRLDGRHFAAPLEGTNWMPGGGALNLAVRPVPAGSTTFAHPLVPLSAGLWRVGVEAPRLIFFDKAGQRHLVSAERRPLLLKVTYFTMFLMLLPALLWSAAHLLPKRGPERVRKIEELVLPVIKPATLPEPLPSLPRLNVPRIVPVPTLFVGLGGAGRRALHAIRADLKQAHLGNAGEPYRFLWVDTDAQEADRELPFEDWEEYKIESLLASPVVRQTGEYLHDVGQAEHLKWFSVYPYRDAPRPLLNLVDGAKGERPLARLALFRWLSQPQCDILETLVTRTKELSEFSAADGIRQIVVIASADGGVGGGWFLDFGRLFQRISRTHQGSEALPDVIGVLCEAQVPRHPENRRALDLEIETAQAARKFPQRVTYAPESELLDQVDVQSPYHWIFSVNARDQNSLAAQCGELVSTLIERHPRAKLLDCAQSVSGQTVAATNGYSAHVLPTLIYDQVKCELFLRLLGPHVLLDLVPDSQGGLKPQPVSTDRASQLLSDWSRSEPAGNPLQLLLAAACNPAALTAFVTAMQASSDRLAEWFSEAFATHLSQQLQGRQVGDDGWDRDCMPAEAMETLRLLVDQLERVKAELQTRSAPAHTIEVVDQTISLARSAANDLESWLLDFCRLCEQVAEKRRQLDQARRGLLRLEGRTYLDMDVEQTQVERWARDGLEAWLGTSDTVSAIRKRLFFAVRADGSLASASVNSYIAKEVRTFTTADEVAVEVDKLASTLALNVPTVRIGGVLANMESGKRRALARELVHVESQPQQVLLVLPRSGGLSSEEQLAIEEFEKAIPEPPAHGPRTSQDGDDHSAIRRLELRTVISEKTDSGRPPVFVEMTENLAESVRRRAENKYQIALPLFPPRLRIALAHPEAFRSFTNAYKAGHVVLRRDTNGREQWSIDNQFLTFGQESTLAHAAANYARDVNNHPESFATRATGGSFVKLQEWLTERGTPDPDTLTQIAMDVCDE